MSAALENTTYIDIFDNILKRYDSIFFRNIDGQQVLLKEAGTIKQQANLALPTKSENTYNTAQFANFIRNIVNFKIKNYDTLDDRDNNMGFVKKTGSVFAFNPYVKDNIIGTLKVINVYVDILEAYIHCIENETEVSSSGFVSGYSPTVDIGRIEIVSDKTRFYTSSSPTDANMKPPNTVLNAGFIRKVKETNVGEETTVLYLSIQSFNTGLAGSYNYDNIFTKTKLDGISIAGTTPTEKGIFEYVATTASGGTTAALTLDGTRKGTYATQKYDNTTPNPGSINLSLEARNKALIVLLLKTVFNLDKNFRKQSVYALYYYYKFVQLYSTLIINVSNVMYFDGADTALSTTPNRIETRNATKYNTYPVSAITIKAGGSAYTSSSTIAFNPSASETVTAAAVAKIKLDTSSVTGLDITANNSAGTTLGSGYTAAPTIEIALSGSGATAVATITPIVTDSSDTNEQKMGLVATTKTANIQKLADIMDDIDVTLNSLINKISTYSAVRNDAPITITTVTADTGVLTEAYVNTISKKVVIKVVKSAIYTRLNTLYDKYDLVNDFTIYDKLNRIYYNILSIKNEETNNFQIEIDAFFSEADSLIDYNKVAKTPIFKGLTNATITKPVGIAASTDSISPASGDFLIIMRKDINGYKSEYINNRDEIEILNEKIGGNTNKVAYQQSLYETQNNKNVFLERQILIYNIIIGIVILILVVINVVKIENHQLVKTISLSCLGIVTLLFVIYFISNITYIETFADVGISGNRLYDLTTRLRGGTTQDPSGHNRTKIHTLKTELEKLNNKFISYFEKLIIILPSTDNVDFYREIKEVVSNDIDNKKYINNTLEYKKYQGNNNIGSLKYELENNKLYINTILISAIIFIGIYNLYINYVTDDKYQALVIFICILIFIVIVSYYIITMNRRVKTVFKNIYWGPENSERF
jgi:hypothetical protein